MTRQTSLEAYSSIKESGELGRLKWRVYDYIYSHGPCTAKKVHLNLREEGQNDGCYTTRLSELREMGLLFEAGTVECEFTGRNVILWDVTPHLPKKLTKKEKIRNQIIVLENKLLKLKALLIDNQGN